MQVVMNLVHRTEVIIADVAVGVCVCVCACAESGCSDGGFRGSA